MARNVMDYREQGREKKKKLLKRVGWILGASERGEKKHQDILPGREKGNKQNGAKVLGMVAFRYKKICVISRAQSLPAEEGGGKELHSYLPGGPGICWQAGSPFPPLTYGRGDVD